MWWWQEGWGRAWCGDVVGNQVVEGRKGRKVMVQVLWGRQVVAQVNVVGKGQAGRHCKPPVEGGKMWWVGSSRWW